MAETRIPYIQPTRISYFQELFKLFKCQLSIQRGFSRMKPDLVHAPCIWRKLYWTYSSVRPLANCTLMITALQSCPSVQCHWRKITVFCNDFKEMQTSLDIALYFAYTTWICVVANPCLCTVTTDWENIRIFKY